LIGFDLALAPAGKTAAARLDWRAWPAGREGQKDGGKKMGAGHFSAPIFPPLALSSSCCSQLSCADYGISGSGQKTYGSVFGMIFFGGAGPPLVAHKEPLATRKIHKNGKNTKKSAK
jgi:hypothetical protein